VPDRLISSVAAGIPVAIPSTGYDACRSYLQEYEAAIEFKDCEELAAKLRDRESVSRLQEKARMNRARYTVERWAPAFHEFLGRVSDRSTARNRDYAPLGL
jgi:hypothetical protein